MERNNQSQTWSNETGRSSSSRIGSWLVGLLFVAIIGGMVAVAVRFVYERGVRPATSALTIECRDQHGCVLQTVPGEDYYVAGDRCEICAPDLIGYNSLVAAKTVVVPDGDFLVVFDYELSYTPAVDDSALDGEGQVRKIAVKCYDALSEELLHTADYCITEGSLYLVDAPFIDGRIATNNSLSGTMPDYDLSLCFYYNMVVPSHSYSAKL